MPPRDVEPRPLPSAEPFEPFDLEALGPAHARSADANDRRLAARRRLATLGKALAARGAEEGLELVSRTSLHHPHAFNAGQVRRLWVYVCRGKQAKATLRRTLGRELAADLDAAFRNAYLCFALEHDAVEVSLRVHPDAWFDGQNLVKRVGAEGLAPWRGLLNELEGFRLRLHDWKGEWPCGALPSERLEEFLRFYTPGEHALAVERRFEVPGDPGGRRATLGGLAPELLLDEAARLLPLYRYLAWSPESDFLFA